jgi:DNA-binding transcriptional ArsR family regulator
MDRASHPRGKSPSLKFAMQSQSDYEWCAVRLKALADPDRLRIVNHLLRGAKNVSELADELAMTIVNTSHHLQVLRRANVLQAEKQGKFVIYSVHPDIACRGEVRDMKSLDLGCCRLDIVQPTLKMGRPAK